MENLPQVRLNNQTRPVLLTVLAHPDDETFGTGGTLALYSRRGVDVHLVCATRGEVGEMDPALMGSFDTIGDKRESELRCAAGTLGLTGVYFLGYRDSGMPGSPDNQHPQALVAQPLDEVAAKVAHYIRLLKPQVVITFDPIGGYRHPDHIAIHQATLKAFQAASDPAQFPDAGPAYQPQKLYYQVLSRRLLRLAVRVLPLFGRDPRHFGQNGDVDIVSLATVDFPVHAHITISSEAARARAAASACHRSQLGGMPQDRGVLGLISRVMQRQESFMRAYPAVEDGRLRESDL